MEGRQQGIFDDASLDGLQRYMEAQGEADNEADPQVLWCHRMRPLTDRVYRDVYGSAVAVLNDAAPYKVVLAAHAEEVGWYVSRVLSTGYLRVVGNGDPVNGAGRLVWVRSTKGAVPGILCAPPVHLAYHSGPTRTCDLFVDVGAHDVAAVEELGIQVGSSISYRHGFSLLDHRSWAGGGSYSRMGGWMLTEVAAELMRAEDELPFALYFVNVLQDQAGACDVGAVVASMRPDMVIEIHPTNETSMPGVDRGTFGHVRAGSGPVLRVGPSLFAYMSELLEKAAVLSDIPVQRVAHSPSMDGSAAFPGQGIRYGSVGFPVKYMHSPVECCDRSSIVDCVRLLIAALRYIGEHERVDGHRRPRKRCSAISVPWPRPRPMRRASNPVRGTRLASHPPREALVIGPRMAQDPENARS